MLKICPATTRSSASRHATYARTALVIETTGRHTSPPAFNVITPRLSASFNNVLMTRSYRIRGDGPYTVPLRSTTGEKTPSARARSARSASTFDFAYAEVG